MPTAIVEGAGRNKFGAWVKINGEFKNSGKGLTFDLGTLSKGDAISFEGTGKYINSITVTGKGEVPTSTNSNSLVATPPNPGKALEIARSVAVKAVLDSSIMDDLIKNSDLSQAVVESKAIMEIYAQYIATGTV